MVGGRTCRCGALGCLEACVGAEAILGQYGGPLPGSDQEAALAALIDLAHPGATLPIEAFLGGNVLTTGEVAQPTS